MNIHLSTVMNANQNNNIKVFMGDTIKSMNKLYFLGAYLTILVPVLKKKILLCRPLIKKVFEYLVYQSNILVPYV